MSWPNNPVNGQQTVVNGIAYQWDASNSVWNRVNISVTPPSSTAANTVIYPVQANITSTGTLSALNVSGDTVITGNLTVTGTTEYFNTTSMKIQDPVVELGGGANGAALTTNDNRDRGLVLHYYSSVASRAIDAFIGWDNSNAEFALGSNVTMSGEVATFNTFGNLRLGNVFSTLYTGTLATASQPNITSLGTLASVSVTGNVSSSGNILGNGQYLSGLNASNITSGTIPSSILGNSTLYIGTTSIALNRSTGSQSLTGITSIDGYANTVSYAVQSNITSLGTLASLSVTANVTAGNISTAGNITANYILGNGSQIVGLPAGYANSNAAAYLPTYSGVLGGTLSTAAQPNVTSLGTLSTLTVSGLLTATGGGVKTGNIIDSTGTNTVVVSSTTTSIVGNLSIGTGGTGNLSVTGSSSVSGNSSVLTGWLASAQSTEVLYPQSAGSSTVTYSLNNGTTFFHSTVSFGANWTPNFTNVPTTDNRTIIITIIVVQGGTAYVPSGIQIDGVSYNAYLRWTNGSAPLGNPNYTDIFSYCLVRTSGQWYTIMGSYSTYG